MLGWAKTPRSEVRLPALASPQVELPGMTPLRMIGAGLAIAGILPATFGLMYFLDGTWVMSSLHHTIRMVPMAIVGSMMVWAGLRLWNKPLRDAGRNLNRAEK